MKEPDRRSVCNTFCKIAPQLRFVSECHRPFWYRERDYCNKNLVSFALTSDEH